MAEPHAAWGMRQIEEFNEFLPIGPWTVNLDERRYRQSGRELRIFRLVPVEYPATRRMSLPVSSRFW